MSTEQQFHKAALQAKLARGEKLGPFPDGPCLDYFNALELAQAIESEVNQPAGGMPHTKITLHMDIENAMKLASYLRRAVLAGV